MLNKPFLKCFLVIALCFAAVGPVSAETRDWLMKINDAAAKISFSGTFAYVHDGSIEAMEVIRRIDGNGLMRERLYSLNGEPREIIRGMNKVWCYIPDRNVAVHDYRQASESGFPNVLPGDLDQLMAHYDVAMGGSARVADRRAIQVNVIPRDEFRYGYSLWADYETGLLLRSDLLDDKNGIVEQYSFIEININDEIADEMLEPVSRVENMQLLGNNEWPASKVDSSIWAVENVPAGYKLIRHIKRRSPMDSREVEHMVFTDGLSSFSIFIKQAKQGESEVQGHSQMGAVNAFRRNYNDHRITVMGEVPAKTVKLLASTVSIAAD